MNLPLELPLNSLGSDEREPWELALTEYADLAKLNLVFSEKLVRIAIQRFDVGAKKAIADAFHVAPATAQIQPQGRRGPLGTP